MNRKTFIFNRIIAVMLLASVFTFAYVWSGSSASSQPGGGTLEQSSTAEEPTSIFEPKTAAALPESAPITALKANRSGFPLLNLQDGKRLETKFVGTESATNSFASAQALTMANEDLNLDGAADLVVGYAGAGGGHLALYPGNSEALSASSAEAFEAIKEGRFPAPFLSQARLIEVPLAPDFIGTGDFNRDGYKDIVAAERGGSALFLLLGNERGNYKPQSIELPGRVTALMAENIDPADGQADVAVALSDASGARLLVFDHQRDVFAEQPRVYPLPAEATSLALGQLDDAAPMDILAAAGGKAVIIRGSHAEDSQRAESAAEANARQVEVLNAGAGVVAVRVGHFIWDRENRPEIALLTANGKIEILQRGKIDTRQYTEEEFETQLRAQEERDQIELMRRSADPTNRAVQTNQKQRRQTAKSWSEADSFQLSSGINLESQSTVSVFTSTRMTSFGVDDLIISDAVSRKIKVLVQNNEQLKATGEKYVESAKGTRALIEFEEAESPAAVLPMRLGVLTRPGLVTISRTGSNIKYKVAAPEATFTVNTTSDSSDGNCTGQCSLRDAIREANAAAGPDIVMVPAGTYTLTIGPSDDSPFDSAAQASGDLDIRDDLTITGAGQATTIIQAGASAATGIDRVLHVRQVGAPIVDLSLSGITIRHGKCDTGGSGNAGSARCNTGGAGLFITGQDGAVHTVTDSTITTNWNVAGNSGASVFFLNGAGVYVGRGDMTLTNATISNNENGASGSLHGGDGGGLLFGFSSSTSPNIVVMNNCTVSGNIARIIGSDTLGGNGGGFNGAYDVTTINGGTYSNNVAHLDGGAIYNLTNTDVSNATVTGNSAKRDGGGIWSDPLLTSGPGTNNILNVTLRNNTADSDGIVHPQFPGDPRGAGGGIYHDRNTLNLTTVTIGGTGASQPNTSFDGGGLGHRYRAVASTNNASTITVNGGSIVGNVANNDGGGIFHDATRTAGANSTISVAPTTAVTLTNNLAKNNGGGVSNSGGASATLKDMQLRSNQANSDASGGGDGGGLYQNTAGSTTTFTGTLTIGGPNFGNTAVNGGGIRNNAGTVTIPGSANISHNSATATGGGISNAGTLSALTSPAIVLNSATGNGGGIFNSGTLGAISAPSIANNSAATGGGIFSSSGVLSVTNGAVNNNVANTGKGGGIEHSGSAASIISTVSITSNTGSGIHITGTGSLDAANNLITGNSGDGITKIGSGTGSHFNSNIIHTNGELGIDLSDNDVTPNDANDTDTGPNNLQNFPVLNYVRRGDGVANVTLNAPNGKYRIQYYANTACDPSGHGEGESLKASQVVDIVSGNTLTFFSPALAFGTMEQITATATHDANGNNNFDDDGSTSEFSACRKVNTLPTIAPQAGNTRQQGSPVSNTQIGVVADPDQTLNTLVVTVNGGASATVNGVTLSNIVVSAGGFVTADIVASCTATNATFTLRVTDNATEFNEANLTVTVTPNTPPTLGTYPNTTVNAGSSGTIVTPNAAPTDNGTVATLTASAPGFMGTFVGNTATGTVTVNSAGPAGIYTVTVTATDNCGATTTSTFQLTVNAIPTITGATISRQQGSPSANSQIATVNDADQAENTLVVTVNGGASATVNGVTVSNIVVDASGNVTADVVASCTATNATFTLTVTDSLGASSNGTLTVNVTPNTPPTVGTYPTTSVNAGAGTTVTPSAAPADNGSIVSATAMASGGFTGTLSVNSTTGIVTVTGANPVGSYTVTVTYTDNCGATTMPTFTLNVVDITPPDTTITANPTDPSGPNVSFSFTGTDAESGVASFECSIDGGAFTACTSPKTYTGLTQGSHTFQVRAIDNATNVDPTPASFTWNVDATPPDTTINTNPSNPSNSSSASFTFSGTDTGGSTVASFQCSIDGGVFSACTSPQNYTGLSDGSHTFQVRAIDGVGNVDASPASYTWVVDATPPDTTITANPTNPSGSNVSFSFTGTDTGGTGIASFECQLDGGGFTACTSPKGYTGLADGSHTFQVRAIDNAGNVDPTPASFTWIVDTMPPDTSITANPTNPSGVNVSFSFTGTDTGSGVASFECDLDGGGFTACTSPQNYTNLSQGSHTFMVRAIDNVGNVDPSPASFTWNVDATAPDTTINTSPPNPSNSGNASFTFSSNEAGTFECDLDGGGFTACTSPKNYTGLSDGSHTFQVRAIDGVGNVDASPASYTWVVDTTGPDTTITANPTDPSNSNSASFSFTGTDTGGSGIASFECQLDGGGFTACTSPKSYTGLSDGSHTFQVRAIDNAGNADATPASFTWTVDTAPPDTTINTNPPNPTNSTNASFTFSGTDSGTGVASFECKLDGGAFAACTSPQNYSGLSDGSHTFQVRAIDGIGNVDPTPASYTWTVDTDPPDVSINQAAGQSDPANGMGVVIHFTAVFNEPVTGFTSSDVTVGGTAGATTVVVTQITPNNGTTYDVAVSGMTMGGTVTVSIGANKANDAAGNGNTASTSTDNTVTYVPNTPPTAVADSYSTTQDTPLNVPPPGVLGNDSDPDAGNTITAVLVSGPTNASSFTLNANGSFNYTPTAGFTGTDSFTYKAKDNFNAESNTVTVTINVRYRFALFSFGGLLFNEQALNQVTAGSDVPIRFTLYGYKGNPYSSPPTSEPISCSTFASTGAATVINRFAPDPHYSSFYDFYQTTWRTQANWKFTCRRLTLYLNDGTTRSLNFYFK